MTWFKADDKLHGHIKARRAGVAAMGLWILAGSYCADNLTDGFVAADVPAIFAGKLGDELAAKLVTAGLWHAVEGGWQFHDWTEYQPTAKSVHAKRAAAKERMNTIRSKSVRANRPRTPRERNAKFALPVPVPSSSLRSEEPPNPLSGAPPASPAVAEKPKQRTERKKQDVPAAVSVCELFEHWKTVMESPRSKLDKKREKVLRQAIDTYSLDDCKKAVWGCFYSDFHMNREGSGNDRDKKFNDVSLIFRDAKQVEGFIERVDQRETTNARILAEKQQQIDAYNASQVFHPPSEFLSLFDDPNPEKEAIE